MKIKYLQKGKVQYFVNDSINEQEEETTAKEKSTKDELNKKPAINVVFTVVMPPKNGDKRSSKKEQK